MFMDIPIMTEQVLEWYRQSTACIIPRFVISTPAAHCWAWGSTPARITFDPLVLRVAQGERDSIGIYGILANADGTCSAITSTSPICLRHMLHWMTQRA